ncbi:CobW/HypB/UreG, nucleotide-binding domain-containing protein [Dipodascopsis uninucleata]
MTATKPEPLPVTLLSGFLGSGKTTLLEHILKSDHGLKIAVIINDMASLNIDASLIANHKVVSTQEKLIQLQNGCICCTLRGDLLSELASLAKSNLFHYVIIESTGISEPMQVAETFTTEFSQAMIEDYPAIEQDSTVDIEDKKILKDIVDMGGLQSLAKLDTTVTVVDAFNFFAELDSIEFLQDRQKNGEIVPNDDERSIADLMIDQLEFADVIIVNKIDMVDSKVIGRIRNIVTSLNKKAKIILSKYSKIDVKEIINTNSFDFEVASTSAGWLQSLNEMTKREGMGKPNSGARLAPKPETEEYGINNFVYQRRRPFHPKRLYKLIYDKFVVMQYQVNEEEDGEDDDGDDDDDDDNVGSDKSDDISEQASKKLRMTPDTDDEDNNDFTKQVPPEQLILNKKASPVFGPLLRSKGFIWLASRSLQYGEWSQAGPMLTIQGGSLWFCEMDESAWPEDPDVIRHIKSDFEGRWGDRRQELVFIGEHIDVAGLEKCFDSCLLTDAEMKQWKSVMQNRHYDSLTKEDKLSELFEDGFEDWPLFQDDEDDEDDEEKEQNEEVTQRKENKGDKGMNSSLPPKKINSKDVQVTEIDSNSRIFKSANERTSTDIDDRGRRLTSSKTGNSKPSKASPRNSSVKSDDSSKASSKSKATSSNGHVHGHGHHHHGSKTHHNHGHNHKDHHVVQKRSRSSVRV